MKKLLALLLSILVVCSMLFVFAACSDNTVDDDDDDEKTEEKEEGIVDTWEGEMDYAAMLGAEEELPVGVTITFEDDGTYTMELDENSVRDMLKDYLTIAAEQSGMTLEELLSASGMTEDELIDSAMSEMEETSTDGEYELTEDSLVIDGTECDYELDANDLTLDLEGMELVLERA